MAYSTGSGNVAALMSAIITHAVADGWTTTGGTWPISKGNVNGIHLNTTTRAVATFATGVSVAFTETILRIGLGNTPAEATARATSNPVIVPNMNWSIIDWHIFSNPGAGKPNYIHVVTRFSTENHADCFNHFSFGELDKNGLSYGSVVYAASSYRRAYPAIINATGSNSAQDWNAGIGDRWPHYFSGNISYTGAAVTHSERFQYIVDGVTAAPYNVAAGWPPLNTVNDPTLVLATGPLNGRPNVAPAISYMRDTTDLFRPFGTSMLAQNQPFSGGVSLQPIPFIIVNGTGSGSFAMYLGSIPDLFTGAIHTYNPKDEITYAGDTWVLMPQLRKTDLAQQISQPLAVTSGALALAYKKAA
jgi:hypothetical protein